MLPSASQLQKSSWPAPLGAVSHRYNFYLNLIIIIIINYYYYKLLLLLIVLLLLLLLLLLL